MGLMFFYLSVAVGVSFLCSILEAVLLSLTTSHIGLISKNSPKTGTVLKSLKDNIDTSVGAILTLNTIAHTIGSVGVGAEASKIFGDEYVFIISALLTLVILYLSEIVPKTIGATYWRELSVYSAYIIKFFIYITYPLVYFARFLTSFINSNSRANVVTKDDILINTQMGEKHGSIGEIESDVIENTLKLNTNKIETILTPRSVVFALDRRTTIKEALEDERIQMFSRVPIYDNNIDNIVGVVFIKKLFAKAISDDSVVLEDISNPLYSINENIHALKALNLFIKRKEHMFLVTDGYGQTSGILTLEDCIETLLGVEIMDESDTVEDMQKFAKDRMKKESND